MKTLRGEDWARDDMGHGNFAIDLDGKCAAFVADIRDALISQGVLVKDDQNIWETLGGEWRWDPTRDSGTPYLAPALRKEQVNVPCAFDLAVHHDAPPTSRLPSLAGRSSPVSS